MKTSLVLTLVLALSGCALVPAGSGPAGGFRQALPPVFQADMPTSLARLAARPDKKELDAKQKQVRACMQARFSGGAQDTGPQVLDGPAGQVLNAYRRYWTAVLMRTATPEQAESGLSTDLAPWSAAGSKGLDAQEESVSGLLKSQGLFVLGGMTPPLRELMVWRRQASQAQAVELPGGRLDVTVTLLDDFVSLGWATWATCDKSHTGGRATEGGIMVVAPAWNLDSEPYRVSLLAHEAQHFSDCRR